MKVVSLSFKKKNVPATILTLGSGDNKYMYKKVANDGWVDNLLVSSYLNKDNTLATVTINYSDKDQFTLLNNTTKS